MFALSIIPNSFGAQTESFAKKHPSELPSQDSNVIILCEGDFEKNN